MSNEDYVRKACAKIQLYTLYGIIPDIDLIMTFETPENPLSTEMVMEKIQKYFEVESNLELVKVQFNKI